MKKKSKRTKGIEQAHPFAGMSKVNSNAAGVDIGAVEIIVCVAGENNTQIVKAFGNYTVDLHAIADWLTEHKVKTVAMESTGVYWIPLFEVLEQVPNREAFLRLAGGSAQARNHRWKNPKEQCLKNEKPGWAGFSDGGAIGEAGGVRLWHPVPAVARPAGASPGDGGDGTCHRARGLSHVEVSSGI
jgi:hypothetical protein